MSKTKRSYLNKNNDRQIGEKVVNIFSCKIIKVNQKIIIPWLQILTELKDIIVSIGDLAI